METGPMFNEMFNASVQMRASGAPEDKIIEFTDKYREMMYERLGVSMESNNA